MPTIPVIDLDAPDADADVTTTAVRLVDAAADHGFIYIRNAGRGFSGMDVDAAFDISKTLFDSPLADKEKCAIQQNNRGWVGEQGELLDSKSQKGSDKKEAFNFGEFINSQAQQPIPPSMVPHEAAVALFRERCHALCLRILHLLGLGLGLEKPDFFSSAHLPSKGSSGTILRFLRYPPREGETKDQEGGEGGDIRAGAHSDYGSMTLLFRLRGQAGLQILTRSNGWQSVPVLPPGTESDPHPPILVNIGDLLSYWTNGLFRSTVHRVVFGANNNNNNTAESATKETDDGFRYSIAYFCHPVHDTPLEPVPCARVADFVDDSGGNVDANPYAERRVLTAKEHLMMRLTDAYGYLYKKGNDEDDK